MRPALPPPPRDPRQGRPRAPLGPVPPPASFGRASIAVGLAPLGLVLLAILFGRMLLELPLGWGRAARARRRLRGRAARAVAGAFTLERVG